LDVCMTRHQIKELRKSRGMTQMQFASLLQCSVMTVRRWERGRAAPNYHKQSELMAVKGGERDIDILLIKKADILVANGCRWGILIKQLREVESLSVKDLAVASSALGEPFVTVSEEYINNLENGFFREPSPARLSAIIAGLGLSEAEFERMLTIMDRKSPYP
jgi:transcriptional regulator with XRE-family HTH domain